MNILMLFSSPIPVCEGIGSHVLGLAKRLKKRGHEITLMTRGNWHGKLEFEYEGFRIIKVRFYPFYPFHIQFHSPFVIKAIKELNPRPDLIHLHSPLVPPLPNKWPIVTTFHTPMLVDTAHIENVSIKTFLIKIMGRTTSYWIEKKLLNISDAIITVSQGVADEIKEFYKFYNNHLYPILNVVDLDFFKPSKHFSAKRELLYIGRLAYRKGLFEIVDSARYVVSKYPDVKYMIIGSGPLENHMKMIIERNGMTSHFEFCGEIRDRLKILDYYQDAYAVLIPSYYEGLPMTLLEAMACGKPIISTYANFTKGLLENKKNALLVNPKSSEELAEATIQLLESQELCRKLGQVARKTTVENMDAETNTNKVEEVYNHAIEKWRSKQKNL